MSTRRWAIRRTQARKVPRAGSKVPALRQTATKTSWTISSAVARPIDLGCQVEDQRRVTAVERAERVLPAGGELAHQLLVAETRLRVR